MPTTRIVWTAVVSTFCGLASFIAAGVEGNWTLALGLASVSAAILSSREQ